MTVAYKDGTTESIFVRELRLRHYETMLQCVADEDKLASLYTDKPLGWADTLTPESLDTLLNSGDELNAPGFTGWHLRRAKREIRMMPHVKEEQDRFVAGLTKTLAERLLPLTQLVAPPSAGLSPISAPVAPSA